MNISRKKMPTILGLFILISGIIAGVYLVQKGGIWFLKAEPESIPKQIRITNISEDSFTVSWITNSKTLGFIKYGTTNSLETVIRDERDELSGQTTTYSTHHVKISNLQPATKYYFKIGSDQKLFDKNGQLYQVSTAPSLGSPPLADTAYGVILKPDGSPAEGVLIYLTLAYSTPLSTLTESGGNWALPLSVARTTDLSSYIIYDPDASLEEIFVQGGDLGTATAIVITQNDSPVPAITLGKTYDFRERDSVVSPTPPAQGFSLEPTTTPVLREKELTILNPEESEEIATQKPEIQGTGPVNKKITITIESPETFTAEVMIDEDGNWSWTPPSGLLPGEHTITISLEDGKTASRSFVVLAAGEEDLPAFTATPSAETTPSPTPLPTSSPTPSPTATSTPSPTIVPRKAMPATEEGVPESGYLTPTITFVILGISLVLTGIFWQPKTNLYG